MSKKDNKQNSVLNDGEIFFCACWYTCSKINIGDCKKIAVLHNMHMPSKILLQNAQILLGEHKYQTCDDVLVVFMLGGVGHCCTWHVQVSSGLKGSYLK